MKIAFLSRYQNSEKRGVESFALELSNHLSKKNTVKIFSGSDADDFQKVTKENFDIIYPLNGRMQSLKFSLCRLFKKYKLVIGGHSGIGRDDIWNIAVGRPDVFVALTQAEENWAKKWATGVKVIKIANGVDLKEFSPTGEKINLNLEKPVILSVGALVWYKYHDRVIDAVASLEKGSLLIVGEGEDREKLEKLGKEKLGERFKIMKLNYEDMPKIYRSTDLFTLPSWDREAFGLVYLEALASGLPVVAPNDLSRKEIVGDGGILVDTSDREAYGQALEKALETDFKKRPREQAEKFSWEIIAKEYENLFEKLINE